MTKRKIQYGAIPPESDAEFVAILTRAAEEGAKRALADVGLDGDEDQTVFALEVFACSFCHSLCRGEMDVAVRKVDRSTSSPASVLRASILSGWANTRWLSSVPTQR